MSVSMEQATVTRVEKEIADLDRKIGDKERQESDLFRKVNAAHASASRASTASTAQTYLRQAESSQKQIEGVKADKSRLHQDKVRKLDLLQQAKGRLRREEESERRKAADKDKQEKQRAASAQRSAEEKAKRQQAADAKLREREAAERAALLSELATMRSQRERHDFVEQAGGEEYDFFISHASEDKDEFVRPLAEALRQRGYKVWYDEFALKVGDNLRRSIDRGISSSRFGVVVLSPFFFQKRWPQRELDALFALDTDLAPKILPIWHHISFDEVAAVSPTIADRIALRTAVDSLERIVDQLAERLA